MAKTRNPYLRLNIYRDKLNDAISDFFMSQGTTCSFKENLEEKGSGRNRLHYTYEDNTGFLDFRFNDDGTTSIDLSSGEKTEFKENLAESIRNSPICTEAAVVGFDKSYFVFKDIEIDDFMSILEMISKEQNFENPEPFEMDLGKRWVIKGSFGEILTITYYNKNKKVMLQGKPLKLFMEFHTYLMTLFEPKEIPKILESNRIIIDTTTKKSDIKEELDLYIPNAVSKLNEKIKKMLCQALYHLKSTSDNFECTHLAFPALKALEGHLKHVMYDKKIPLEKSSFTMFKKVDNNKYALYNPDHIKLFSASQLASINDAYQFYKINRHSLFHWDELDPSIPVAVDTTRLIENPAEAFAIINNTFKIIDAYYKQ